MLIFFIYGQNRTSSCRVTEYFFKDGEKSGNFFFVLVGPGVSSTIMVNEMQIINNYWTSFSKIS